MSTKDILLIRAGDDKNEKTLINRIISKSSDFDNWYFPSINKMMKQISKTVSNIICDQKFLHILSKFEQPISNSNPKSIIFAEAFTNLLDHNGCPLVRIHDLLSSPMPSYRKSCLMVGKPDLQSDGKINNNDTIARMKDNSIRRIKY